MLDYYTGEQEGDNVRLLHWWARRGPVMLDYYTGEQEGDL